MDMRNAASADFRDILSNRVGMTTRATTSSSGSL